VLTDEGAAVLWHAQHIEEEALAFERRLRGQDQGLDGTLRLSCSDWFCVHMLAPVIAEFAIAQPNVVVELLTDARLYSLPRREADLVFRIQPLDEPEVIARRLVHISYGIYLKKGLAPQGLGNGAGTDLITMDTAFGGMPDAVWLSRVLPKAESPRAATTARFRRACVRWAAVSPCCRVRLAMRFPKSSGSIWAKIRRAATPLSATTAISNVWPGCAPCWSSSSRGSGDEAVAGDSGASQGTQPTPYHRTSRGAIQSVPTDSTSQRPG
jgi:DNA-binding transcriptional LysR family regulator